MKFYLIAFFSGFLFAIGLGISGMIQVSKIFGFLDFLGKWDPTLLFVMVGAISTHVFFRYLFRKRIKEHEDLTIVKNKITFSLIFGAILFGAGWGLGGYCPGPAVVSSASLQVKPFIFLLSMIAGMRLFSFLNQFNRK